MYFSVLNSPGMGLSYSQSDALTRLTRCVGKGLEGLEPVAWEAPIMLRGRLPSCLDPTQLLRLVRGRATRPAEKISTLGQPTNERAASERFRPISSQLGRGSQDVAFNSLGSVRPV